MRLTRSSTDLPRSTLVLSGGIFTLSICSFMVVPLLALYLASELHVPAGRIGIVLAVMAVANQGLQVVVGIVSDRLGSRTVFSLGVLAASVGYLGFAYGPPFPGQLAFAFALGLGRATISLVGKVLLTQEAGADPTAALTVRSIAVNAGAAVGPVIGGLLFGRFGAVLVAVVAVHALFWLVLIRTIPRHEPTPGPRPAVREQVATLVANRPLLGLTCATTGFWFLYTQVTFTIPLYADDRFQLGGRVALLFALNAVLAVALQYWVVARWARRYDSWGTLAVGCGAVAAAFLVVALVPSVWALVSFIVLFSLGEIIVVPTVDILTAEVSAASSIGGSFGLASLGWAGGGVLGSLAGGALYQAFSAAGRPALFWAVNVLIGLGTVAAFLILRRRFRTTPGAGSGPTTDRSRTSS